MISLYSEIQNPLEDPETIRRVFESYSKSINGRSFYDELINRKKNERTSNDNELNKFNIFMHNNWGNRLVKYDRSLIKSKKEYLILDNKSILPSYIDLKWDNKYMRSKWTGGLSADSYINSSRKMTPKHTLYINVNKQYIYKFAQLFVEYCDLRNLPFDFKLMELESRDDCFQIFTNDKYIVDFIELVEGLRLMYPYLINSETPLLTGKISDGIGYGSLNESTEDFRTQDFYETRANLFATAINETTVDYIKSHKDRKLEYHSMSLPFYDYLSIVTSHKYIESLKKSFIQYSSYHNEKEAEKYFGFKYEEIGSTTFQANIYNKIRMSLDETLDKIKNSNGEFKERHLQGKVEYSPVYLCDTLKTLSPFLFSMDEKYRNDFSYNLSKICETLNLDKNNISISNTRQQDLKELFFVDKYNIGRR